MHVPWVQFYRNVLALYRAIFASLTGPPASVEQTKFEIRLILGDSGRSGVNGHGAVFVTVSGVAITSRPRQTRGRGKEEIN